MTAAGESGDVTAVPQALQSTTTARNAVKEGFGPFRTSCVRLTDRRRDLLISSFTASLQEGSSAPARDAGARSDASPAQRRHRLQRIGLTLLLADSIDR